jgi:hypothetical protein
MANPGDSHESGKPQKHPKEYFIMSDVHKPSSNAPEPDHDSSGKSNLAKLRFLASMEMNHEKWHDGIGYDLAALDEMNEADRDSITDTLATLEEPWRSFEALARINSPKALAIINGALKHPSLEVRIVASRFARGADDAREQIIIEAIERSDLHGGLSQALNQIEEFHTPRVIDALFRGLLRRGDAAAVNFAGMLLYLHGKANSAFGWDQRPLFLRFSADDLNERKRAFNELCNMIGRGPPSIPPRIRVSWQHLLRLKLWV